MNRLTSVDTAFKGTKSKTRVRPAVPRSVTHSALPQCLLAPLHYERNYAYPLIVWLHASGGDEREIKRIMPLVSLRNYVSLAVRGIGKEQCGFSWPETADTILAAESRVADGVALARQRFHIHHARIFLAGYGSGGTMALRLALRNPDRYAGAASIAGAFPQGQSPLIRLAEARQSKLLMMHCRDSQSYTIAQVCQELALFHAAGMSATLRQYPCDDELTTQMLHDLDVWLMEQVTGVVSSDDCQPTPIPSQWN